MQQFENKELKNLIMHRFESIAAFCEAAGITDAEQFAQDIERSDMSAQDIIKAARVLDIKPQEIDFYFFRPASDPNAEQLNIMFEKLTPENKQKAITKYFELLAEQEQGAEPCKV